MYIDIPFAAKSAFDKLSAEKQRDVYAVFQSQKKDPTTALILAIFGFSLFYVGKAGMGIMLIISCIFLVGLIWWVIEIINAKKRVEAINTQIMQKLLMQMT